MISIEPVIIVEGRYDKNKIKQIFDTVVLETSGFGIFKDKEKAALIRRLARTRGILVLTDPDHAGFLIRGYLKNIAGDGTVYHAYIPDRLGKERRKAHPSREGKLGVEGVTEEEIIQAVRRSGVAMEGRKETRIEKPVTKADLYAMGLSGGSDSKEKRRLLLKKLDLPENMTAGALLEMINILGGAPLLEKMMDEV